MGKDETSEPLSKKKGDKIMRKKIAALLAMLMLGGVLTGCGGGNKVATGGEDPNVVPEDTYEINWYMQGMPQEDVASVEAAVNDYLKDKINATLKMHRLESNQYSKQLNTMIAAGEYFDIAWTTPGVLTYTANARNGAWLALDDYIDTYIPKTIEQLGEIADNASFMRYRHIRKWQIQEAGHIAKILPKNTISIWIILRHLTNCYRCLK
jgi:ABC-type glycerol-3-phosphate transport system substrate-binding protein